MQELRDKINVGYGYMLNYIWPELRKDERFVDANSIHENEQREALTPKEKLFEVQKIRELVSTGRQQSIRELAGLLCKSPEWVAKILAIEQKAHPDVRKAYENGEIGQHLAEPRYAVSLVVNKTIDTLIADMIKVLGIDEQTARDTVTDLIRNKDKIGNIISGI